MKLYKVKISSDCLVWFNNQNYEGGEYFAVKSKEGNLYLLKNGEVFYVSGDHVISSSVVYDSESAEKESASTSLLSAIGTKPSVINITF